MRVVLLPQAQQDLDRIHEPLFSRVIQQIQTLKEFPEMGPAMLGLFAGYRSTVVELFRIVYRILPSNNIEIAYIRDCRRRPIA